MIRRLFAVLSRYRPRALTLVVMAATGALLVLANLSEEVRPRKAIPGPPPLNVKLGFDLREPPRSWNELSAYANMSFGWPLLWRQYVVYSMPYGAGVVGENYSAGRLAGNAIAWLLLLAAPAGVCEWLLRRYRPRLRFSLRTLLAATGLAAALCGWFVAARNRANVQDPLIAALEAHSGRVCFTTSGPTWLEKVGADRFCRKIAGVELLIDADDGEDRRLLGELKQLPGLRYLALETNRLSPEIADGLKSLTELETLRIDLGDFTSEMDQALGGALGGLLRLRALRIGEGSYGSFAVDAPPSRAFAALAGLPRLEHLRVEGWSISSEDLTMLKATKLKSLTLASVHRSSAQDLLSRLPALAHLESLDLQSSEVFDEDLRRLAVLPRLKSLGLMDTNVTGAGLAELAPVVTLEELVVDGDAISRSGVEALLKLENLKRLHVEGFDEAWLESPEALRNGLLELSRESPDEIDGCLRAIAELRRTKPELVIDGNTNALDWPAKRMPPNGEAVTDDGTREACRRLLQTWKEQRAKQAAQAAAAAAPAPN